MMSFREISKKKGYNSLQVVALNDAFGNVRRTASIPIVGGGSLKGVLNRAHPEIKTGTPYFEPR